MSTIITSEQANAVQEIARALRLALDARGLWSLHDEGTLQEIRPGYALDISNPHEAPVGQSIALAGALEAMAGWARQLATDDVPEVAAITADDREAAEVLARVSAVHAELCVPLGEFVDSTKPGDLDDLAAELGVTLEQLHAAQQLAARTS